MIHDLDETIKQILFNQGNLNRDDIDIVFDQPTGEWAAGLSKPTINIYLYDIRENLERRNTSQMVTVKLDDSGERRFPPRRIDLNYLITVWANEPADEHQLLWRILQTLISFGKLNPEDCVGAVRDQPIPMPLVVALPSSAVRNMPDLWGVMENQLKPSINFTITLALDPDKKLEAPLTFGTTLRFGQAADGRDDSVMQGERTELEGGPDVYHVGGRIYQKGDPVGAGVVVRLLNRGDEVQTDSDGRYMFAYMRSGEYQVAVTLNGNKPKNFTLTVPAENPRQDYDLSL